MKDYTITGLDYRTVEKVIFENDYCLNVTIVQGALVDSYFIDDFNLGLKMNRGRNIKPRKHLMVLENYLNCWSSDLTLILTDNDSYYYQTKRDYLTDYLKNNKKDPFLDEEEREDLECQLEYCNDELKNNSKKA